MAFTTPIFLFFYLPLCFGLYLLADVLQKKRTLFRKLRAADLALLILSCGFYLWAGFSDLVRFSLYILLVFGLGQLIHRIRGLRLHLSEEGSSKLRPISLSGPALFAGVALVLAILVRFKYTPLLTRLWNFLFKTKLPGNGILAPLGISFITFSAISYLADIRRGLAQPGNLLDCALYLTFFPKVVSGPIVLWRDFSGQIPERKLTLEGFTDGILRLMAGFAKKLILADTFGACIASAGSAVDVPTAFGISLLYMLQIYYDFSGYSDIALGLSRMLGFSFRENFNFPYLSCSITEFWRRWHISLGTWFREYVYYPLGGSRAGKGRTLLNIGIVFALTGIWHGAGLSYMLWGMINGFCNMAEKCLRGKPLYEKTPKFVKWFGTMTVTFFCWQLFRFGSFSACVTWLKTMFGLVSLAHIPYSWQYFFDTRMVFLMAIAILGSTVWGFPGIQDSFLRFTATKAGFLIQSIVLWILFLLAILFMVNSSYSPFIYFQY